MGCTNSTEVQRGSHRSSSPFVRSFSDKWMMKRVKDQKPKAPERTSLYELMDGFGDTTNTFRERLKCSPAKSTAEDYLEFDLDVISDFRQAMKELTHEEAAPEDHEIPKFAGISDSKKAKASPFKQCLAGGEGKIVMYLTSLGLVRKTFEDCWNVKLIIRGYGFRIDERDVSMHGGFKDELQEILGPGFCGSMLPRVFANGKYLGGAEDVMGLHEAGKLEEALRDCEVVTTETCEGCGDVRFVPCVTCSGSCKLFVKKEEGRDVEIGLFRRCSDCNENGIVRCPLCWY